MAIPLPRKENPLTFERWVKQAQFTQWPQHVGIEIELVNGYHIMGSGVNEASAISNLVDHLFQARSAWPAHGDVIELETYLDHQKQAITVVTEEILGGGEVTRKKTGGPES